MASSSSNSEIHVSLQKKKKKGQGHMFEKPELADSSRLRRLQLRVFPIVLLGFRLLLDLLRW